MAQMVFIIIGEGRVAHRAWLASDRAAKVSTGIVYAESLCGEYGRAAVAQDNDGLCAKCFKGFGGNVVKDVKVKPDQGKLI